jgi:hypothetical protein
MVRSASSRVSNHEATAESGNNLINLENSLDHSRRCAKLIAHMKPVGIF